MPSGVPLAITVDEKQSRCMLCCVDVDVAYLTPGVGWGFEFSDRMEWTISMIRRSRGFLVFFSWFLCS